MRPYPKASMRTAAPALAALLASGLIVLATVTRQGIDRGQDVSPPASAPVQGAEKIQPPPPSSGAPASTQVFARDANGLRISVAGMPRAVAAERLATLTGSRIASGGELLALSPPLDLDWRGHDPIEAWKRVLGGELRHSVRCGGAGCVVNILSIAEVEGGTVLAPEQPTQEPETSALQTGTGLMNRPTDPDAIDESSLSP